jgi:tetratricopeptide (TPR) repeat protein
MSQSLRYSRTGLHAPGIESVLLARGAGGDAVTLDSQALIQQCRREPLPSEFSIIAKEPSAEELCVRGLQYFYEEDFAQAVETFTELVKIIQASELYLYLGVSYYELEDMNRAAAALEKAVRLRPENAPAQFVLASVYITPFLKSGDASKLKKAIKPVRKAIQLGHHLPMDYHYLGIIYEGLGNWSASEENYRKAIELDIHLEPAYLKLAYLYCQLGEANPEEREFYLTEAIET